MINPKVCSLCILILTGMMSSFQTSLAAEQNTITNVKVYYVLTSPLVDPDGKPSYRAKVMQALKTALLKSNIKLTFIPAPWNRVVRLTSEDDKSLLFQLIRTKGREKKYHWLTSLNWSTDSLNLYTRSDKILTKLTKEQIINGPYKAVCQINYAQCDMLLEFGFPAERITKIPNTNGPLLVNFVLRGRADFMAGYALTIKEDLYSLTANKNSPETDDRQPSLAPVFSLKARSNYLVASLNFDPDLLVKIKQALSSFKLPNIK